MKIIRVKDPARLIRRYHTRPVRPRLVDVIVRDVEKNGDRAVRKYEKRFGAAGIRSLRVTTGQIRRAYSLVPAAQISAIRLAASRLARTETVLLRMLKKTTTAHGSTRVTRSFEPIPSVGCYVPGGAARYPSSAVMSVVPARVAGVPRIAVVSPPGPGGTIDPLTIVAADICGATEIYCTGGAQAIAALAYGTRTISAVDKIVGPGGPFVTAAKHAVSDTTSIDMTAGPTELCVICDSPKYVQSAALDLISQAEHSVDASCYALVTSASIASSIRQAVMSRLDGIRRSETVRTSLKSRGFIGICDADCIIRVANGLAPEHLEILSDDAARWARIRSAGLVLVGDTPSAASDYLLGSNHILPTGGFGRTRGSLSVLDFVKMSTRVRTTKSDLRRISKHLESITESEGLFNHYGAVAGRLQ